MGLKYLRKVLPSVGDSIHFSKRGRKPFCAMPKLGFVLHSSSISAVICDMYMYASCSVF